MSGFISGMCFILVIVSMLLVLGQVDALQTIGKANTSGALQTFFDTPVMLVLLLMGGLLVFGVMAALMNSKR